MRIAVIGDGLVARSLLEAAITTDDEVVLFDHSIIDVVNPETLEVLLDYDVCINTAAYHRLAECEANPRAALLVNAIGASAVASRLPTIFISTDYVFNDGGPHAEVLSGAVPRSVYGHTKAAGELATVKHGGIVVRISSVWGHYRSHKGKSLPEQIATEDKDWRLPVDQFFSATYMPHAAPVILGLAYLPDWAWEGSIYHVVNEGYTNWRDFGRYAAKAAMRTSAVYGRIASDAIRPRDSRLMNTHLLPLPHWHDAMVEWAAREGYR